MSPIVGPTQAVVEAHWVDAQTTLFVTTPGDWLVATVAWRYTEITPVTVPPVIGVADAPRNVWTLLSTNVVNADHRVIFPDSGTTAGVGELGIQVWACPAVFYDGWPYDYIATSLSAFLGIVESSVVVSFMEITDMGNDYLTVDAVVPWQAYVSNSVTQTMPAPQGGAECVMMAVAATDISYGSYTTTGVGWTQMTNAVNTDTSLGPTLGLVGAWQVSTTAGNSVSFNFAPGFNQNWVGLLISFRTTGIAPAQPNPNWPAVELQFGYGYDLSQPTSTVWWTDQTSYYWAANTKRGIQYELGAPQAEASTITLRNDDGTFSPRNTNVPPVITCTATGTTTTFKCTDAAADGLSVTDLFRLSYAAINSNTDFSGGTTGWTGTGGTFTVTNGVGQIVPTGSAATVMVESTHVTVVPGRYYDVTGLLQNNVARGCTVRVNWYNSGGTLISSPGVTIPLAANTLGTYAGTFIAPSTAATGAVAGVMTGTPPSTNVMFLDNLVLKPTDEFTSFKVTALSSAAGTTTVTYEQTDDTKTGGSIFATKAGDVATFTPIDMYLPYRVLMSWNGKREYLTSGWIERWPQNWRDPHWGTVGALGISALATITAASPTSLQGEIYRRSPIAYWPMSDASGSPTATNASGRTSNALVVTVMNAGGGTSNSDFGAITQGTDTNTGNVPTAPNQTNLTSLIGDPGTAWDSEYDYTWDTTSGTYTGNGLAEMNANQGTAMVGTGIPFPPISGGVTIFWIGLFTLAGLFLTEDSNKNPTVFILRNTDPSAGVGQGSVIKVSIDQASGACPAVTVWDKTTHASTTTVLTGTQYQTTWHAYALAFTQTSWTFYFGGTVLATGSCNLVNTFTGIDVAGEADQFFSGNPYPGLIAHVAVYDQFLTEGDVLQMTVAAQLAYGGGSEYTSQRIQRKLDTVGMKTGRVLDELGKIAVDAEGTDASTITDLVNQIAGYEDAYVFEDAAGVLQYRPPARYAYQDPVAVLGEDESSGELPYQPGPEIDFDPTYLYNQITIINSVFNLNLSGQSVQTTTFTAQDDDSATKYNLRTYGRNTRLDTGVTPEAGDTSSSSVFYLAYWLLANYASGKQRFQTVVLNPAANPDLWTFCLRAEVAQLVTVVRRPIGAPEIRTNCVIMQVEHDTQAGQFLTTLTLAPARIFGLITNDDVRGIAGTNYFTME